MKFYFHFREVGDNGSLPVAVIIVAVKVSSIGNSVVINVGGFCLCCIAKWLLLLLVLLVRDLCNAVATT